MKIKTCIPDQLPLRSLQWDKLVSLLGKAHETIGRYDELLRSIKHPEKVFSVLTCIESLSSLHSQKVSATLKEVLLCQAIGDQAIKKCDKGIIKILNYKKAMTRAASKIKKNSFSFELMCSAHKTIKQDTPGPWIGRFREQQNWIGPEGCKLEEGYFYPPEVKQMHRSLEDLKEYFFLKEKDPLVQLAIFFAQLLIIHPFMDGNGRVGRVLIPLFLYKRKIISCPMFYMSSYFKKHRLQYFEKLFKITTKNAWIEWIQFFLKGIIQGGELQILHAEKILSLYNKMSDEVAHLKDGKKVIKQLFANPIVKVDAFSSRKKTQIVLKKLQEKKWIHVDRTRLIVSTTKLITINRAKMRAKRT